MSTHMAQMITDIRGHSKRITSHDTHAVTWPFTSRPVGVVRRRRLKIGRIQSVAILDGMTLSGTIGSVAASVICRVWLVLARRMKLAP